MNTEQVVRKIIKKWDKHKKILVFTDIQTIFEFKKLDFVFLDLTEDLCLLESMNRFIIPVYDKVPQVLLEKEKIKNIPEILILSLIRFRYENFKYFSLFSRHKRGVIRTKIHKFDSVENLVKQCTIGLCLVFNQFSKLEIDNLTNVKIVKNTEEAVDFISQNQISVLNIIDTGDFKNYICTNLGYRRIRKYSVYNKALNTTPKYVLETRKSLINLVPAGVYHSFVSDTPDEENEPNVSTLNCMGVGLSDEITKLSELIDDQSVFPILALIEEFEARDFNKIKNFYSLLKINPFENRKYAQTLKRLIDDEKLKSCQGIDSLKEQWPSIIGDRVRLQKMLDVLRDKGIFCFPIFKRDKKTGKFYNTITEGNEKTVRLYDVSEPIEKDLLLVFQKIDDILVIYLPL